MFVLSTGICQHELLSEIVQLDGSAIYLHVQWNPVNKVTNEPWKFGCINKVGPNFMTGLNQVMPS